MDQQPTDPSKKDLIAYSAAWLAMLAAAILVIVNPGSTSVSTLAREKAELVEKTKKTPIAVLAAGFAGVFAGSAEGPAFTIRPGGDGLPVAEKGESIPVTALLVAEQALWMATPAAENQPSRLQVVIDPLTDKARSVTVVIPELLQGGEITALASGFGRIWVGTTKGLFSYDWARTAQHRPPSRFKAGTIQAVKSLYVDCRGVLWIGTDAGLLSYNGAEAFPVTTVEALRDEPILALTGDERGGLLCGTTSGLWICDEGQWVRQARLDGPIKAVLIVGDKLLAGTPTGLHAREDGDWKAVSREIDLPEGPVTSLAFGGDRVYVGTTQGLHSFALFQPSAPKKAHAETAPMGPLPPSAPSPAH